MNDESIGYMEEAIETKKSQNRIISESGENYIRALLNLRDSRVNHRGIDALDASFSPPIKYEIKIGKAHVKILDTQFHYKEENSRSYFIMVKREDNVNGPNLENSLLLNFGDIYILPTEIIIAHYIAQRAKSLAKKDERLIGKGRYKNFDN